MNFTVVFFYFLSITFTFGFNFDTDFPIIYTEPPSPSRNLHDRSSYFGYSVILHHAPRQEDAWIQIGAPRANSSGLKAIEPGKIFRCNIFGPCQSINVDTSLPFINVNDKKDNAWIGGAMDIDERSGIAVVCGHRWINNKYSDYWMEGVCYWSHVNDSSYDKLIPLADNRKAIIADPSTKNNVYYYAQGQAGFSAHMTNLNNAPELLLGAPGVYNWDGTTMIYRDSPDFSPIASRLVFKNGRQRNRRAGSNTQFLDLNIGNTIATMQTASFGLFGYSLTSGYFFKKNELLYVSGGPRSKANLGQILVYSFAKASDQALVVRDIRQGYQLGEYFGSALTAGDINQDGLDDLVIGAPFYSNSKFNEGRIFVFLGSKKGSLETPRRNSVIEGKAVGGQFGTSLMFLGDLHMDGYADVAVGSPYENDGSGVVYIYRGNSDGLDSNPSQRIVGNNFMPTIRGFGISMSKPTDIDNNFYPDLAIGAYISGHVVLVRSKPVVTLQQKIHFSIDYVAGNTENFQVKACFWYKGDRVPSHINVTRNITVDELFRRAYLPRTTAVSESITLYRGMEFCQNFTILIKSNMSNRYDPITVTVQQELANKQVQGKIIDIGLNNQLAQYDKFCKDCPVVNPYKSIQQQTIELPFAMGCGDDIVCITKLDLQAKFLGVL